MANFDQSLFLVLDDKTLVAGPTNGATIALPSFVQGDALPLKLTVLRKNPTGGISTPFQQVSDQLTCKVGIVTPHPTAPQVHAYNELAYVASQGTYNGSLSLNTTQITSLLGSATSVASTFEIEVSDSTGKSTLQLPVTIAAQGIAEGVPIGLSSGSQYYTAGESDARYLGLTRYAAESGTFATTATALLKTGGTATGELSTTVATPSHNGAFTTKSYVDSVAGAIAGTALVKSAGTLSVVLGSYGSNAAAGNHTHTTTVVAEGTNLYFTNARVNSATWQNPVMGISTDPVTGDALNYAIERLVNGKLNKGGGTMTGALILPGGSLASPTLAVGAADAGLYRPATDDVAIAADGQQVAKFGFSGAVLYSPQDVVQLSLQAYSAGQTADMVQIKDSSANVMVSVSPKGGFVLANDGLAGSQETGVKLSATSSTGRARLNLVNNNGGNGAGLELHGGSATLSNGLRLYNANNGPIVFETFGGAEAMRISEDAAVGIGTDNPSEVLHVVGNLKVEGNVISTGATEPHGFIYTSDDTNTQALTGTPAKLTAFVSDGPSYLCTNSAASDQITVTNAGVYAISANLSVISDTNNVVIEMHVHVDGVASVLGSETKLGTAGDVKTLSLAGILSLNAGQVLTLYGTSVGNSTVTYHHANLAVHKL